MKINKKNRIEDFDSISPLNLIIIYSNKYDKEIIIKVDKQDF